MTVDWKELTDEEFSLIDEYADGFENLHKRESHPQIEDWLVKVNDRLRPFLLHELLRIEVSYSDAGKESYLSRFPDQPALLDSVFGSNESTFGSQPLRRQNQNELPLGLPDTFEVQAKIGSGGMGTVYHAVQTAPVKRQVAIKVLRATPDSEEFVRRFEFEQQVLVQMDHPFVARLFEAGLTANGLPFFTMEYIRGVPINEHVATNNLSLRERLVIFLRVCEAIQHAHQKGIIHRDLKPRNILVTTCEGEGVPKVIDFGLAKAFDESTTLDLSKIQTGEGQLLGTLNYMSPEQARYDAANVDTRSDIYSLGVILYELLTGTTPLESESITELGVVRSLGLVERSEYPRPLQRTRRNLSKQNRDRESATPVSTDELDSVVMKALSADSNRRYATVQEFADDINNFLACKPVLAKRDSILYRANKFVRRNWVGTTFMTIFAATVLAASFLLLNQQHRTRLAEADFRLKSAELDVEKAESALKTVRIEKAETEAKLVAAKAETAGILLDVFQDSLISHRKSGGRLTFSFESMLDTLLQRIENAELFPGQRAQMYYSLAIAFNSIERPEKALEAIRECLRISKQIYEKDNLNTIKSTSILFRTLWAIGDKETAIEVLKGLVRTCHEVLGPSHLQTLASRSNLANAYVSFGKYEMASRELEQVLKDQEKHLDPDNSDILTTRLNLAQAYSKSKRIDEAIQLMTEAREKACQLHRPEHSRTISIGSELVRLLKKKNRFAEAIVLQRDLVRSIAVNIGTDADQLPIFMAQLRLGKLLRDASKYTEAIEVFKEYIPKYQAKLSSNDPDYYRPVANLAGAYAYAKEFGLAAENYQLALNGLEKCLGKDATEVKEIRDYLGYILEHKLGEKEKTNELHRNPN